MAETTSLYVNATVGGGSWVNVGTGPYLDSQNATAYIGTTSSAMSDQFTFATSTSPGTPTNVVMRCYVTASVAGTSTSINVFVSDNGSTYNTTGFSLPITSVWSETSVDLSAYLNSWAKVNAARAYFQLITKNKQIYIDAASLYVTFTTVAATGSKFAAQRRHARE